MSTPLLVLKVIGPPLAQGLLDAFGIKSKLANAVSPKNIGTVVSGLLKPGANYADSSQKATEIAGQMADDIRPLFEGQDRQVALSSRDAIIWSLAETLVKAGLTQAGLAEMNFDAKALEHHLLKVNPGGDRDFSEAERSVYQQAVKRASLRLIDVAPAVEWYEQAKTAEVLQRLEAIAREFGVDRARFSGSGGGCICGALSRGHASQTRLPGGVWSAPNGSIDEPAEPKYGLHYAVGQRC
ncbi:MAG: hypothetical protein WBA10_07955 [Elainellaceae cyanobacterium]